MDSTYVTIIIKEKEAMCLRGVEEEGAGSRRKEGKDVKSRHI